MNLSHRNVQLVDKEVIDGKTTVRPRKTVTKSVRKPATKKKVVAEKKIEE